MFKKIYSTFVSNFVVSVFNLLIVIIISQFLGAVGKGEQSIFITTIAFVLLACNIVGGATLVYLVPRYNNKNILQISYLWSFIVCFLVYFILSLFGDLNLDYVLHICLLSLLNSFVSINSMIVLGKEKINAKNIISLTQTSMIVFSLLYFFLFLELRDIYAYVFSLYIGFGVAFFVSLFFVSKYFKVNAILNNDKIALLKAIFRLGMFNQLSHITQLMSLRLSYYILLIYIGKDSVGVYSVAIALVESVWLVSNSIATVQYAKISNSSDELADKELTIRLLRFSLLISFILLIILSIMPSVFYQFLLGKEFSSVDKLIIVLSPGVLLYNFSLILGHYFSGKGRYHVNTIASVVGLVFTLIFTLLLVPIYDYYGAAIAACISYFSTSFYVFYIFKKESTFKFSDFFPDIKEVKENFQVLLNLIFSKNEET